MASRMSMWLGGTVVKIHRGGLQILVANLFFFAFLPAKSIFIFVAYFFCTHSAAVRAKNIVSFTNFLMLCSIIFCLSKTAPSLLIIVPIVACR